MRPDGATWDYQWSAVLATGVEVDGLDRPQSFARSLGRLRSLIVRGKNLPHRFGIELPSDAQPSIVQIGSIHVTPGSLEQRTGPIRYGFGWETEKERRLWVFGPNGIEHQKMEK